MENMALAIKHLWYIFFINNWQKIIPIGIACRAYADCHTILQHKLMKNGQHSQLSKFFNVLFLLLNNGPHNVLLSCGYSILNFTLVFEICMLTVTLLSKATLPCPTLLDLVIRMNEFETSFLLFLLHFQMTCTGNKSLWSDFAYFRNAGDLYVLC